VLSHSCIDFSQTALLRVVPWDLLQKGIQGFIITVGNVGAFRLVLIFSKVALDINLVIFRGDVILISVVNGKNLLDLVGPLEAHLRLDASSSSSTSTKEATSHDWPWNGIRVLDPQGMGYFLEVILIANGCKDSLLFSSIKSAEKQQQQTPDILTHLSLL
jgi:hypothetical protein